MVLYAENVPKYTGFIIDSYHFLGGVAYSDYFIDKDTKNTMNQIITSNVINHF